MKLHKTDHTVIRGGTLVETNFTVRTTAKTFAILSSGLYSDKIAAPIRELCCNAYDAHVAADNQEVPFEVILPTVLNPTFSVRDYGTGLSNDDVRNLYTTYFDSTKTDSDEMIGALGLGSKSPFAYTSSFSIESRFEGKLSTYAAYINENGVPALSALLEDVPTDESNGMTISFPVKATDIDKFVDRAKRILMYFPVKPVVHGHYGFAPHELKHTVEGSNWKIRDASYYAYMSGAHVIQGSVAYPLKVDAIADQLSEAAAAVARTNLDLFVPIGQVEVAPSREALGYDPVTIANLVAHLENATKEMRESIQASIDKCSNMWAARKTIHRMSNDDAMSSVFKPLHQQQPFTFKALPIDTTITLDVSGLPSLAVEVLQVSTRYGRRGRGASIEINIDRVEAGGVANHIAVIQQPNTITIVDDMGKGFTGTVRAYAKEMHSRNSGRTPHFVMIRPVVYKDGIDDRDMINILAQLGGPETITVTSIAPAAAARKAAHYRPRKKTERLVFTGFETSDYGPRRKFSRLTWERREIDLDDGGYYVCIKRFDIEQQNVHVMYIDELLRHGIALGILPAGVEIVGFADKEMDSIAGNDDWVNVFDHLDTRVKELMADPDVVADAAINMYRGDNYDASSFIELWPAVSAQTKHGEFKEFFEDVSRPTQFTKADFHAVQRVCALLSIGSETTDVMKKASEYVTRFRSLYQVYSMLQLIDLRSVDKKAVHHLIDYINTCEDAIAYAAEHLAA